MLLVGPHGSALFLDGPSTYADQESDPHAAIARLVHLYHAGLDVVLAEGFAPVHDLLIQVERRDVPRKETPSTHPVWLTVTDEPDGVDRLGFDAIEVIVRRILDRRTTG